VKKNFDDIKKNLLNVNDFNMYKMLLNNYLFLKEMDKSITKAENSAEKLDANSLEDIIYLKNGIKLTEKEKILYDYNRIKKYILRNKEVIKKIDVNKLKNLQSSIENIENGIDNIEIKKEIVKIEMQLGMTVGFYSVVDLLVEDLNNELNEYKKSRVLEKWVT